MLGSIFEMNESDEIDKQSQSALFNALPKVITSSLEPFIHEGIFLSAVIQQSFKNRLKNNYPSARKINRFLIYKR